MASSMVVPSNVFAKDAEEHVSNWDAQWIWDSEMPTTLPEAGDVWMNFRKEVTLDKVTGFCNSKNCSRIPLLVVH